MAGVEARGTLVALMMLLSADRSDSSIAGLPASAASESARAPIRALVSGPRFADGQRAASDFLPVHGAHGRVGLRVVGELDESKSLGAPGIAVRDELGRLRLAERSEEIAQLLFGGVVREIAHVQ